MREDGAMARMPDLEKFAKCYDLKICAIKDLIKYRLRHDRSLISCVAETILPTTYGEFKLYVYKSNVDESEHVALVQGDIEPNKPVLTRVHSECLTGDVFASRRCDCGEQLRKSFELIAKASCGVLLYLRQEGRGIGLANKVKAYSLQNNGLDTVDANLALGFGSDLRDYGIAAQILSDLNVQRIRLLTNNPHKIEGLLGGGLEIVERVPLEISPHVDNYSYLSAKKAKLGHLLDL